MESEVFRRAPLNNNSTAPPRASSQMLVLQSMSSAPPAGGNLATWSGEGSGNRVSTAPSAFVSSGFAPPSNTALPSNVSREASYNNTAMSAVNVRSSGRSKSDDRGPSGHSVSLNNNSMGSKVAILPSKDASSRSGGASGLPSSLPYHNRM
jgi:hypothetical protein